MTRSIFGWSYPPGCSGPPEYPDPTHESEHVCELLEQLPNAPDAAAIQELYDQITIYVENLAIERNALREDVEFLRTQVRE